MCVIVSTLSERAIDGTSMVEWHATVAEELNDPPSSEFVRLMLGSIKETWQRGDTIRREDAYRRDHPPSKHFGADFGRMDFSEPGRGGWGVDAWD